MKIRYGMPKYSLAWAGLFALGLLIGKDLGMVLVAAGMTAFVLGMIAERKESEANSKISKHKRVS
jgi:hypothetical protein